MKIGIVGGGIIGLTTGVVLAEAGHKVEVFSRDPHTKITSWAAAAISCPVNVEDSERVNIWYARTNKELEKLLDVPEAGVSMVEWRKYSRTQNMNVPSWVPYAPEARVLQPAECPAPYKYGIYARMAQMVVDEYFPYMMARFKKAGGTYTLREISSPDAIADQFDVLVNATGIGARQFVNDNLVQPARGQVVIVENPGGVTGHVTAFDTKNYVYPRGKRCLLGGSFDVDNYSFVPDEILTKDILAWASEHDERLANAEIFDVRVGLRPLRPTVRLEKEILKNGTPFIHNYGHGGAGYTLSWGCAFDVLKLVDDA